MKNIHWMGIAALVVAYSVGALFPGPFNSIKSKVSGS